MVSKDSAKLKLALRTIEFNRRLDSWVKKESDKLPRIRIRVKGKGRTEELAMKWLRKKGLQVYPSLAKNGYRAVGVLDYWKKFERKLPEDQKKMLRLLKDRLGKEELKELVESVKNKIGTPDLMVITESEIEFLEVKSKYETVKLPTLMWMWSHPRWKLKVLVVERV